MGLMMSGTPVGLSRDLEEKRVMRAEVQGQDVAVWRDPDGDLHAWNNRCPHRGMRLSHGFVRDGKLACLYHGWHYGKDGGCAYIPAHPDLAPPATITAVVYHITEASGVIWVNTNTAPEVSQAEIASKPLRSLACVCSVDTALASFTATPFGAIKPVASGVNSLQIGDRRLMLYASTLSEGTTLVHVCVDIDASVSELKALSRWCEAARRKAEGQTA